MTLGKTYFLKSLVPSAYNCSLMVINFNINLAFNITSSISFDLVGHHLVNRSLLDQYIVVVPHLKQFVYD